MSVVNVSYLQQADWTYNSAVNSGLLYNHAAVAALCLIKYNLWPDPQQLTLIWEFAYRQWWHYVRNCSVCVLNKRHDLKTVCSYDDVVPFSVLRALRLLPFCCYLILGGAVTLPPSCAVVMKSGNLYFLEPSRPFQACNRTALPLGAVQMSALRSVCCHGYHTVITIIHCHIVKGFPFLSYWRHHTMRFTGDLTWHYNCL